MVKTSKMPFLLEAVVQSINFHVPPRVHSILRKADVLNEKKDSSKERSII